MLAQASMGAPAEGSREAVLSWPSEEV